MKPRSVLIGIAVGVFLASACSGRSPRISESPAASFEVLFHEESGFGSVYVVQQGNRRSLRFDSPTGDNQSEILLDDPTAVPMEYVRLSAVSLTHVEAPRRVMMIGLGGGSFSTLLWRTFPEVVIDAVEIDPVVARVAAEFFGVPSDDPRYAVKVGDGLEFAEASEGPYDLIFVDAYDGSDIPEHLARREFFDLLETRLAQGGSVVLNMAVPDEREPLLMAEFLAVFEDPACYRAVADDNLIVIGGRGPAADEETARARAALLQKRYRIPIDLDRELAKRVDCSRIGPGH